MLALLLLASPCLVAQAQSTPFPAVCPSAVLNGGVISPCDADIYFQGSPGDSPVLDDLAHMGASLAGNGDWDGDGQVDILIGGLRARLEGSCTAGVPEAAGDSSKAWLSFGPQNCLLNPSTFCPEPYANLVRFRLASPPGPLTDRPRFGWDVTYLGDLDPPESEGNNFGCELAISAPLEEGSPPGGGTLPHSGTVYVMFLRDRTALTDAAGITGTGSPQILDPAAGIPGVSIVAIHLDRAQGWFGHSISGVGDVFGDTTPDVAIGAPSGEFGDASGGLVMVVDGSEIYNNLPAAGAPPFDLWLDPAGTDSFTRVYHGTINGDRMGYCVSGYGDLDGDGKMEIAASGPQLFWDCVDVSLPGQPFKAKNYWTASAAGEKGYVQVLGWSASASPSISVRIIGESTVGFIGKSLSGLGNLPDQPGGDLITDAVQVPVPDGLPDLLIGAPLFDVRVDPGPPELDAGRVYLISGAAILNANMLSLSAGSGPPGGTPASQYYVIDDGWHAGEQFGWSVAGGGNFTVDGRPEFLVGSRNYTVGVDPCDPLSTGPWRGSTAGRATMYCGATLDAFFRIHGEQFRGHLGFDVAWLGDLDGSGFDEFMTSATAWDNLVITNSSDEGRVYVFGLGR